MEKRQSFIEFIHHICKRPNMYTLDGSFKETATFIVGYSTGNKTPISNRTFSQFVCLKNSFPSNYVWPYVIKECSKDDNEAILIMKKTILEFIELKDTMTEEELLKFVMVKNAIEEGEAENAFRKFDKALLTGNKEVIESLATNNKDLEILWTAGYPEDVALKLNELSSNQPIKCIPITEDNNKVKIIAQGWPFPIEMNFINGNWKVNATKIIELRKTYRTT